VSTAVFKQKISLFSLPAHSILFLKYFSLCVPFQIVLFCLGDGNISVVGGRSPIG